MRKVLTPEAEQEAVALYKLRDAQGNPMYSQLEIACQLGVSETTIFRLLKRETMRTRAPIASQGAAQQSEAKFRAAMLRNAPAEQGEAKSLADVSRVNERVMNAGPTLAMPAPRKAPVMELYADVEEEALVRPDEDEVVAPQPPVRTIPVQAIIHEVCNLPVEPKVLTRMKEYLGT